MRPSATAALVTMVAAGSSLVAAAAPAAVRTTGRESMRGQIIAPAVNGHRTVVSSIVVARGVFNGVGKVVEVPNRPGDPDNVSRDDLVFPAGTIHILNISRQPQISLDPQTCAGTVRIKQTTRIQGGTRRFRHAAGTTKGTVRAYAVLARNADGSCNEQADALLDADTFSGGGTISF